MDSAYQKQLHGLLLSLIFPIAAKLQYTDAYASTNSSKIPQAIPICWGWHSQFLVISINKFGESINIEFPSDISIPQYSHMVPVLIIIIISKSYYDIIWLLFLYWLVVWNMIFFPFSWEFHHPNWRTPSFFRGVGIPPTSY